MATSGSDSLTDLVQRLREQSIPQKRNYSLRAKDGGIRTTLMREAWRDAGITLDDPGSRDQVYLPDEQLLIIDLGGNDT